LKITASRHDDHAKHLLGDSSGIVTSGRWWAYNHPPVRRRQVCWSHLQRDLEFLAEGRGSDSTSAKPGWPSVRNCSGPGRSTPTPASAESSNAASGCYGASSKPCCAGTPSSTPATARPGGVHGGRAAPAPKFAGPVLLSARLFWKSRGIRMCANSNRRPIPPATRGRRPHPDTSNRT
jgi:hypothetical protein